MHTLNVIFGLVAVAVILRGIKSYGNCITHYKQDDKQMELTICCASLLNGIVAANCYGDGFWKSSLILIVATFATWCLSLFVGVKIASHLYLRRSWH